ncbi:DoxX family protein [Rhodoferax koreense]|uniref:DoxX family protein n=1 Tax=Rhodoferax koreensis TaxID=1842727 RepID=A0A1P8JW10_9BURK|nr:DoxX family protein [Rhodoferax koreense]APW37937.1 DoxX family protein [Rhodoferax koreense]
MASTTPITNPAQDSMALIGRILIAALFIPAGWSKLMGFAGTVGYITSVGLPLPQVAAAIAVIVELGLGILLLVGYKTRIVALIMAIFTVATAVFFHNYWAMPADKVMANQMNFFKNLAIAGGMLAFASFGAGRFSVDKQ